jgi:hypothetical protein
MNVINELTDIMREPPALSLQHRDRAKETLMNQIATTQSSDARRRHRRIAGAGIVAVAAAAALVVGVALPGRSPLSARPASAVVAIRAVADTQRALPDRRPNLANVSPAIAALAPTMRDFPADGSPPEVWSWIDAHCEPARAAGFLQGDTIGSPTAQQIADQESFMAHKDCGLLGAFVFLQLASPAQTAALLDALAALPTIAKVDGPHCTPGGSVNTLGGKTQEFRVSRNGTDTVLTITHTNKVPGNLLISMLLWNESARTPCPDAG